MKAILFFFFRNILTHLDSVFSIIKPNKRVLERPKHLLIVRWDRIGDAVATLPLIEAIHESCPTMKVDVLCSEYNAWIFEDAVGINKIIKCPGVGFSYGKKRLIKWLLSPFNFHQKKLLKDQIGQVKYDQCLDCVAGEYTALLRPFATQFIGPKTEDGFSWLYDAYPSVPLRYAKKTVAQYFFDHLCTIWGIKERQVTGVGAIPINHSDQVVQLLDQMNEPFILINGAGSEPIRSFKEDQLVTLINDVVHHIKVVIFDDHHQNVISKIGHLLPKEVLILPVLSLPELAAISKKATFLIGNEGGATHYCATQCQSLKLFASKSYDHHFYAFLANRNRFIKKELENMAVWSNGAGDYAIIPKPRRRYPFRPYYIDHEQPNIAIENIVAIILEVINNRMIGET